MRSEAVVTEDVIDIRRRKQNAALLPLACSRILSQLNNILALRVCEDHTVVLLYVQVGSNLFDIRQNGNRI
jgi:hypothetical protein